MTLIFPFSCFFFRGMGIFFSASYLAPNSPSILLPTQAQFLGSELEVISRFESKGLHGKEIQIILQDYTKENEALTQEVTRGIILGCFQTIKGLVERFRKEEQEEELDRVNGRFHSEDSLERDEGNSRLEKSMNMER